MTTDPSPASPIPPLPGRLAWFAPWRWSRDLRTGATLIALAPVPVLITYRVVDQVMKNFAAMNPTPNQGAMVVAFFVCIAALAVGVVLALAGLGFLVRGASFRHARRNQPT